MAIKLLDFWAPWCGPCRMMEPILHELEEERKDVEIVKINADEKPELTSQYGVMGLPTYVVLKDDKEVGRKIGFTSKQELVSLLNS